MAKIEYAKEERAIKVKMAETSDQVVAFQQEKEDPKGTFRNNFAHLALP